MPLSRAASSGVEADPEPRHPSSCSSRLHFSTFILSLEQTKGMTKAGFLAHAESFTLTGSPGDDIEVAPTKFSVRPFSPFEASPVNPVDLANLHPRE